VFEWLMDFIPGLELSERFFHEIVEPALAGAFPGLRYGAALIGYGSEVLGYDTPMSTDHNWGPRLLIFVSAADRTDCDAIAARLDRLVPDAFMDWPTRIALHDPSAPDADRHGRRPARLRIEIHVLADWFSSWLGCDIEAELAPRDWLGLSEQKLLEVTQGRVYRDDDGALAERRRRLAYFPRDVWLYKLACQWIRIGQEQAFVGRSADVGDELGSSVIAARLARDVMRLCFLIERRYAPYPKWFGTGFAGLECAAAIGPHLLRAVRARARRARERALDDASAEAAAAHNRLGCPGLLLAKPMNFSDLHRIPGAPPERGPAPERDFWIINADEFASVLFAQIAEADIAALPRVGGVDQFSDSTDLLSRPALARAVARSILASRPALAPRN
jgi:hypothetical protein